MRAGARSSRITRPPGGGRRRLIRGRRFVGWRRVRSTYGPTGSRRDRSARCSRRWGFVWRTGRAEVAARRGAGRRLPADGAGRVQRGGPARRPCLAPGPPGRPADLDRSAVSPRGHGVLGMPGPAASDQLARRDLSRGPERPPRRGRRRHSPPRRPRSRPRWGLAANAVATWIVRGELPALEGKVQTLDLTSWKAESHTLVRLPYCPACGGRTRDEERRGRHPADRAGEPARRRSAATTGTAWSLPEVTLQRYGHHVSPITGAVSMLERVGPAADAESGSADDGTMPMHVYVAGHNLARRHRSLAHLRGDLRNMSSGKGASDVQARASGLCEGLERYSGVFRGDEPGAGPAPGDSAVPPSRSTIACSSATGSIASATPGTPGSRTTTSSRCRSTRTRRSTGRRSGR